MLQKYLGPSRISFSQTALLRIFPKTGFIYLSLFYWKGAPPFGTMELTILGFPARTKEKQQEVLFR